MRYLVLFVKGLLMGGADLIPGVSGGSVALITGIYEELLKTINSISWKTFSKIKTSGIKFVWNKINGNFLIAVLSGVITSIILFSWVLEWLLKNETIALWSFFFGILLASFILLLKIEIQKKTFSLISLLIGILISYQISKISPNPINVASLWYIFIAGFFGISAMILPGVSGAYILLLMGVYQTILRNFRQAIELIFNFNNEIFTKVTPVLGVFFFGIIIGIKFFSKFLIFLLKKYPKHTMSFLIGLMIGALNKVWPWRNNISENYSDLQMLSVLPQNYNGDDPELSKAAGFAFLGFMVIIGLQKVKSFFEK